MLLLSALVSLNVMALEVGETGPCVVLDDIQPSGETISQCLRTPKKKGEFVLLDFSMPKCEDCVENLPLLANLKKDIDATTTTRIVVMSRNAEDAQDFVAEHSGRIDAPFSLDTRLNAKGAYGVDAAPTMFVLNSRNKIIYKHVGILNEAEEAKIKSLVAKP